jgi:hypothetical protein
MSETNRVHTFEIGDVYVFDHPHWRDYEKVEIIDYCLDSYHQKVFRVLFTSTIGSRMHNYHGPTVMREWAEDSMREKFLPPYGHLDETIAAKRILKSYEQI